MTGIQRGACAVYVTARLLVADDACNCMAARRCVFCVWLLLGKGLGWAMLYGLSMHHAGADAEADAFEGNWRRMALYVRGSKSGL